MNGHLGPRVSALLDGQLPDADAERAWAHVHACHACRDAVEREGWVKTRLAGLSAADGDRAPAHLKGSLLAPAPFPAVATGGHRPRRVAMIALGGSAAGMAVLGVLVLGVTANSPGPERRAPVTNFGGTDVPAPQPARVPGSLLRPAATTPSR